MEETDYYRIKIAPSSLYRHAVFCLVVILLLQIVWSWPYYLPSIIKLGITVSIFFYVFFLVRRKPEIGEGYLYVRESGELVIVDHDGDKTQWKVDKHSFALPWQFNLRLHQSITQKYAWYCVFTDQITQKDVRRLRRIISKIKTTKVAE